MTQMEAMKSIMARDGGLLRPQAVVDEARPEESPLHNRFEWDNTVAGEKYRLLQAQRLIREFVIEVAEEVKGRAFINLSIDRTSGKAENPYRLTADVVKCPDLREVALKDALAELEAFRNRYAFLKELSDIFEAIDKHTRKRTKGKGRA